VVAVLVAEHLLPLTAQRGFEEGELVIMMDRDQSLDQQRHELLREWQARHGPIKILEVSATATAARSQMVAHAQSGAAPEVDVYSLDVTWTAEFASAGLLRPLDESRLDLDGFLPGPLGTGRYDGKQYALPLNTDAGLLFYRKDLISSPPTTLAEMVAQIDDYFRRPDEDEAIEAGFAGQLGDYEGFTVNALELIWAAGGEVVDADGEVAPIAAMAPGVRWLSEGWKGPRPDRPPVILPECLEYDEDRSRQAFEQGRVLFMRNWPVAYRLLTEPAPGEDGPAPMDPAQVGVARLPWPSVLGGQNLAVAASTDQPRAAQALIEFLTSERSQQKLFEGGFAPTREVVYYDGDRQTNPELMAALLAAVHEARPRPSTRHYEQFSDAFRSLVRTAVIGDGVLPPDTAEAIASALKGEVPAPDP
jgi:multiple sugar transport system substrate-binding protein